MILKCGRQLDFDAEAFVAKQEEGLLTGVTMLLASGVGDFRSVARRLEQIAASMKLALSPAADERLARLKNMNPPRHFFSIAAGPHRFQGSVCAERDTEFVIALHPDETGWSLQVVIHSRVESGDAPLP